LLPVREITREDQPVCFDPTASNTKEEFLLEVYSMKKELPIRNNKGEA
jgi:hypothetical protein